MFGVQVDALAKINLHLGILSRREDGYHDVETIYQAVSLSDSLHAWRVPEEGFRVRVDGFGAPEDESNLVVQAAQAFHEEFKDTRRAPQGLAFLLTKQIPIGAGLGGGSSDACAALLACNALYGSPASPFELMRIARGLGADVPFFFMGGTCYATGIGDRLYPIMPFLEGWFCIAYPNRAVPTRAVFEAYDKHHGKFYKRKPKFEASQSIIIESLEGMSNDFETFVRKRVPDVEKAHAVMTAAGFEHVRMTGSGSSIYGYQLLERTAERNLEVVREEYPDTSWLVRPVGTPNKVVNHFSTERDLRNAGVDPAQ